MSTNPSYAPERETSEGKVFTVTGGQVAGNVVFADPAVFRVFGLPDQLPPGDFRPAR